MQRYIIEKAYECAKTKFNSKPFTFIELHSILKDEIPSLNDNAVDLYIELLQDIRFISLGKQKWALRENFTVSQINKISSSMFGLDEYHEEDADKYMSEIEKKELKSKIEKDNMLIFENTDDEEERVEKHNIRKLANEELIDEDDIEKHTSSDLKDVGDIDDDIIDDDDDDEIQLDNDEVELEEDEDEMEYEQEE